MLNLIFIGFAIGILLLIAVIVYGLYVAFRYGGKKSSSSLRKKHEDWLIEQDFMQQQMDEDVRRLNNPYDTPGIDPGIDEAYHGMDTTNPDD